MTADEGHEMPVQPAEGGAGSEDAGRRGTAGDGVLTAEAPQAGLSWSWELDFEALLAALNEPAPWNLPVHHAPGPVSGAGPSGESGVPADSPLEVGRAAADPPSPADADPDAADAIPVEVDPAAVGPAPVGPAAVDPVEADLAEYLEAVDAGRSRVVPLATVAGRIAESLPAGPDLAGWLATGSADELEDGALAGVAASYRRLASWAQAGELAVVAQMASKSAAADDKIGVDEQGRPARLPEEACAQVSLALVMSQASASWWSDLAVTLTWRLAATGAR